MPTFIHRIAAAVAIALVVVAVFASIWITTDDPGLQAGDLLRVEQPSVAPPAIATAVEWSFELFGGERVVEPADMDKQMAPSFAAGFTPEDLNSSIGAVIAQFGPVDFVRYTDFTDTTAEAIGVSADGTSFVLLVDLAPDGRIGAWSLDDYASQARIPGWQLALALAGAWVFVLVGILSYRAERLHDGLILMLGALSLASIVLVLAQSSIAYTAGRVVPAAGVVFAVWLLLDRGWPNARWTLAIAAIAAAIVGMAPLLRDSVLVGHPRIVGQLADSAGAYRAALVGGAMLTAVALTGVALLNFRQLAQVARWQRSVFAVSTAIALSWALISLGTAIDYAFGDGRWAEGGLRATSIGLMASVPIALAFRSATSRWNRPELAGLVIDLDAGGGDLQGAVATALEDPDIRVVTSPDGERLVDDQGNAVIPANLGPDLSFTRIQAGGRLVGGLVHRSAHRQHPERLRAVVAAVGMALEVGRLNDKVVSQLEEVEASRARIVSASDNARRRIERDLHDGAQQRLVALGIDLQRARRMAMSSDNVELQTLLDGATADVRGTIEDIRAVSRGSHPALLTDRGLQASVDALAERSPVPVAVNVAASSCTGSLEVTVYYVIAEALTNVAKHSGATEASVVVGERDGSTVVEITDDGGGGAHMQSGSGLQGLEDRVAAAGGVLTVTSDDSGTSVKAVIPCG